MSEVKELVGLKKVVYAELVENEQARRNDTELLLGVFKRLGINTQESFASLANSGKLRQMESITRFRRKLQEEHPELRVEPIATLRNERQKVFKALAKEGKSGGAV